VKGRPPYREVEHTADIGFELEAPDRPSAFERAALAMFDTIVDIDDVRTDWSGRVRASGEPGDVENLMVRWLSELLYLHEIERVVLGSVLVEHLDDRCIEAVVAGERFDPDRHVRRSELKAATYHDLVVQERHGEWSVRVIFDT